MHTGVDHKVTQMIQAHIYSVVHHVVSLSAIVAMLHGKRKIELKHLDSVRSYVTSKCGGHIKGGMSMASDFYGYAHPAYSNNHANAGVQVSEIQWGKQEARPSQGPAQTGGSTQNALHKELQKQVKKHVGNINASISKGAQDEIVKIVDIHLNCFFNDLSKEGALTVKKVEKVLNKRRHKVFE